MVSMALRTDFEDGGDSAGDVHVAICALRSTVSSGYLTAKSTAEATNVATLQLFGFNTGSRFRYDLRKSGALVEINVGNVDVRNVIGIR